MLNGDTYRQYRSVGWASEVRSKWTVAVLALLLALVSTEARGHDIPEPLYRPMDILPIAGHISFANRFGGSLAASITHIDRYWGSVIAEFYGLGPRSTDNRTVLFFKGSFGFAAAVPRGVGLRCQGGIGVAFGELSGKNGFTGSLYVINEIGTLSWDSKQIKKTKKYEKNDFSNYTMGFGVGVDLTLVEDWFDASMNAVLHTAPLNETGTPYEDQYGHTIRVDHNTVHLETGPSVRVLGFDILAALKMALSGPEDVTGFVIKITWLFGSKEHHQNPRSAVKQRNHGHF